RPSLRVTPGTLVAIGRDGPRTSAGASGLGSNESIWAVPPLVQNRITDLARPNFGPRPSAAAIPAARACKWNSPGSVSPPTPRPPHVCCETLSLMKWTLPSAKSVFTPPECQLREAASQFSPVWPLMYAAELFSIVELLKQSACGVLGVWSIEVAMARWQRDAD